MLKRNRRPPTPARIPPEDFRYGGYRIVGQPNSQNWYRQWREKGVSSTKRRSLETEDFEEAKKVLVAFVAREFADEDAMRGDPLVTNVLDGFAADPMVKIHCWSTFGALRDYAEAQWQGVTLRVLTPGMLKDFARSVIARGCGPGYAGNQLSLLSRAFAWAGRPRDDNRILCPDPPRIQTAPSWVCAVTGARPSKPKNWSPEPDGMAKVVKAMARQRELLSWGFLALYTVGRPTAVRLLGPHALSTRRGQAVLDLHPKDWPRSMKRNPCLPVTGPVLAELLAWEAGERWCPYSKGWLNNQFEWLREACGMPLLQPASFRDFGATALRHAHLDFGTDEVTEEYAERWMGHRDVPTTDAEEARTVHRRYGLYRPDYLRTARLAMEATMLELDRLSDGALFRHTNPHADRQNPAEHRRSRAGMGATSEGKSAFWGPQCSLDEAEFLAVSPWASVDLDAIRGGETVEIGGIRGSFRQVTAKPAMHLDEAFERQPSDILWRAGSTRFQFVPEGGGLPRERVIVISGTAR